MNKESDDLRCAPKEHEYAELWRAKLTTTHVEDTVTEVWEPVRLYCHKCGWVRQP